MQFSQEDVQKIVQSVLNALATVGNPGPAPVINPAFKYKSNSQGFVKCKLVDNWLSTLEAKDRAWLPNWFNWPAIHKEVEYESPEARLTARANLSNRNWMIFGQRMLECFPLKWITTPRPGADVPWDDSTIYTYQYGDGFVPNSWSWGWDDKDVDEAFILAKVQAFYKNGAPGSGDK